MMVDMKCYCYNATLLDGSSQHGPIKVPKGRFCVNSKPLHSSKELKEYDNRVQKSTL